MPEQLPYPEFERQVADLAAVLRAEVGDAPEALAAADVQRLHATGHTPLAAAAHLVSEQRMRAFTRGAYTLHERRVCEYLIGLAPEVGCGMDPIGHLMASHNYLRFLLSAIDPDGSKRAAAEAALGEAIVAARAVPPRADSAAADAPDGADDGE